MREFLDRHGEGVHHVAMWQSDNDEKVNGLAADGMLVETRIVTPEGKTFVWFSDPRQLHGVRLEYVDAENREAIERWIASGEMEGGFTV